MDRHTRRWLKGCGLAALLLLIASLLSFDLHDPTITNLRYPKDGIANLAGLPGALVGGSLVELLGASSLWIPALFVNWMLIPLRQRNLGPYLLFSGAAILFSSALHGILADDIIPGLTVPGLAGIAGSRWMLRTMDAAAAAPLLGAALVFALAQLVRVPLLGAALRDGRMFSRYFRQVALARASVWWAWQKESGGRLRRVFSNLPGPLSRQLGGGGSSRHGGAHATIPRTGVTEKPLTPGSGAPSIPARSAGASSTTGAGKDGFDAWISAVGRPAEGAEPAEKP